MGASASPLPTSLAVAPGDQAVCEVRVRNSGAVVDQFTFEVQGGAAAWTQVVPPSLNLLPSGEGAVQLQLRPPRQPTTAAGQMPIGLKVISKEDPDHPALVNGVLEVGAYDDLSAELLPRSVTALRGSEHRLTVANMGNAPVNVTVAAQDPDQLIGLETEPSALAVPPGMQAAAVIRTRLSSIQIRGRERPHPFEVVVSAPGVQPIKVEGSLIQRALLPGWLVIVITGLIAVGVALGLKQNAVVVIVIGAAAAVLAVVHKLVTAKKKLVQPPAPQ